MGRYKYKQKSKDKQVAALRKQRQDLREQLDEVLRTLDEQQTVGTRTVELFKVTTAGAIGASVGAWVVRDSVPKELLKTAVEGTVGGGLLIVVSLGARVVKKILLRRR